MNNIKTIKLSLAALFIALCCVLTMVVRVPSPTGGYLNLGDAAVLLSAYFLGPIWGAITAGLGSALADLFAGYLVYAPGTLLIKAAMAFTAGTIFYKMKRSGFFKSILTASISAESIMVLGYLAYSVLVLNLTASALTEVFGNIVQGIFGITASTGLYLALIRIPYVRRLFSI